MRNIFTICLLLASATGFTQITSSTIIDQALAGRIGCGIVPDNSKIGSDTTKTIDLHKGIKVKATGLNISQNSIDNIHTTKRYFSCGRRVLPTDSIPLLFLDGVIVPIEYISTLIPDDIAAIDVLKYGSATAIFGSDGVNGAIIVTTKKTRHWQVTIKDSNDNKVIPAATIEVKNKKTGKYEYMIANDSGFVLLDKQQFYNSVYSVSAIGFEKQNHAVKIGMNNMATSLFLQRRIRICEEVIIKSLGLSQTICERGHCKGSRIPSDIIYTQKDKTAGLQEPSNSIQVYPNPAAGGSIITIKIGNDITEPLAMARVLSTNGLALLTQKLSTQKAGTNIQVYLDTRWPAGIYFVQLLYANGKPAASERIVIQ
jgi:TonB-dependent SusC/RagA subfamily outer membrane receptor